MLDRQWWFCLRRCIPLFVILTQCFSYTYASETSTASMPTQAGSTNPFFQSRMLPLSSAETRDFIFILDSSLLRHFAKTNNQTVSDYFLSEEKEIESPERKSEKNEKPNIELFNQENYSDLPKEEVEILNLNQSWKRVRLTGESQSTYSLPDGMIQIWSDNSNDKDGAVNFSKQKEGGKQKADSKKSSGSTTFRKKPTVSTDALKENSYRAPLPALNDKPAEEKIPGPGLRRLIYKTQQAEKQKPCGNQYQPFIQIHIKPDTSPVIYMSAVCKPAVEKPKASGDTDIGKAEKEQVSTPPANLIESLEANWQSVSKWLHENKAVLIFEIKNNQLHISYTNFPVIWRKALTVKTSPFYCNWICTRFKYRAQ